ncbi:hypothetical protein LCGC14_2154220 [marine sediment metagenome]|uniref:Uncharacterized protein n=1 Tax=marine sediment metagenome TaxID=412755 RepID=A0A0F9EGW0_9ZZZZ|nr:hypothetical protein [Desulfobacterales bacterium]
MPEEKANSTNNSSKKPVKKLTVDEMVAAFEARGGKKTEPENKEEDGKTQTPDTNADTDKE